MVLDSTSSGPPSSRGPRPASASGGAGMTPRFTDAMWAEIRPIYDAILGLPFNRELAAGTLSRERFSFYMVQDAHYLGAFARALATAAAKATTPEAQVKFAKSAHDAIVVERTLHQGFFHDFGITPERFAATRPPRPVPATATSCSPRPTSTRSRSRSPRSCLVSRFATRSAGTFIPDSPFGSGRHARRLQKRWRNGGFLLSPAASVRTRPPDPA